MSRTTLRLAVALALVLAATAAACSGASTRHPSALAAVRCPVDAPAGARIDCFRLTVPESRARPDGKRIRLLVLRFRSRGARPAPDPVLWLAGGPGGSAVVLTTRPALYESDVAPLLERRDVVVLEQRGALYSRPALTCRDDEDDRACLRRLAHAGNDLRAYTSAASADDIEDLRRALGIERWNVLGESYGTRVAQTLVRLHPEGLRSVVLDSVVSIGDDTVADSSAEAAGAFRRLFAACAASARCNRGYPDLEATLRRAFERLEAQPLELAGRAYGTEYAFEVDGARLLVWTYEALYETAAIPYLPRALDAAARGRLDPVWRPVAENFEVGIPRLLARGLHRAVTCNEEVPFTDAARIAAVDAANAGVAWLFSGRSWLDTCRAMPAARPSAIENAAVESAVPTLLLAGALDPVTPPAEARRAARLLSHSFLYTFPGLGHWVNPVHACPRRIMLAFLDRPAERPDASCIAAMKPPAWTLP